MEASIAHNPDEECQDFFLAISSITMEASIAHNPDDECQDFFFGYIFNQHGSEKVVVTEQRASQGLEGYSLQYLWGENFVKQFHVRNQINPSDFKN